MAKMYGGAVLDKVKSDSMQSAIAEREGMQDLGRKAQAMEYLTKSANATLVHDTAMAMNVALKSAKDLTDKLVLREFDAERQILKMLADAQQAQIRAAQVAGRAEFIASKAANYAQKMSELAQYSQSAAGQASAAQMAQAMGFPVAARGVPSPLPPPDIDSQVPMPYVPGMPLQSATYQPPQPGMFSRMFGQPQYGQNASNMQTAYQPSPAGSGLPPPLFSTFDKTAAILVCMPKDTRMQCLANFL